MLLSSSQPAQARSKPWLRATLTLLALLAGQAEARALTGAATAAASSSRRSSQATGELLPTRPLCQLKTFGLWKEQEEEQPGGAQLAPAELHAGSIILTVGGKPWARLDIGDAPGAAQWPFILPDAAEAPGQTRQEHCACCRLCHVQNDAASSAPNRCQRWSFRARDGACRLFAPAASDVQPLALSVAAEDRAWYSGAVVLSEPYAAGEACRFIVSGTGGGSGNNSTGGTPASPGHAPRKRFRRPVTHGRTGKPGSGPSVRRPGRPGDG